MKYSYSYVINRENKFVCENIHVIGLVDANSETEAKGFAYECAQDRIKLEKEKNRFFKLGTLLTIAIPAN